MIYVSRFALLLFALCLCLSTYSLAYAQVNSGQSPSKIISEPPTPSALEAMYSKRIDGEPKQFGYELFKDAAQYSANSQQSNAPMGAVQDDFVLNAGDQLLITFSGQRTDQNNYKIDSSGMVIIKDLAPIPAMGNTIAQFRATLNAKLSSMPNTQSYVSLSSIKQIGVLVIGHVNNPGRKNLSAFSNVLDALNYAGGINKDGSLRHIKLIRSGKSTIIDLYSLLMDGAPDVDTALKDGDRLIIPPIGPNVAISGAVKRPGIYEIHKSSKLSLNEMLEMAGGVLSPGKNRFMRLSPTSDGQEAISEIKDASLKIFTSGTILNILSGDAKRQGTIELVGQIRRPGIYDLSRNKTLGQLLNNKDILGDDIYPHIGVIKRWSKEQLSTHFINFPVRLVFKNEFDLNLHDNDVIYFLSNRLISSLYEENNSDTDNSIKKAKNMPFSENDFESAEELKIYLKEHSIYVRGAVRRPGKYPVSQEITLDNIIAVAGGFALNANQNSIEITSNNLSTSHQRHGASGTQRTTISLSETSPSEYILSAGDSVRINQKYRKTKERSVYISGEVLRPGEYDLLPGDKVSNLIKRAGGVTAEAYPAGAIFSRESERRTEEKRFRNAARDMKQALAASIKREDTPPNASQIEMVRSLADELSNIEAIGRITVEVDPAILSVKPELDMLLEHKDRVYVPKRPLSVRVTGEVLSPSSLQFVSSKSPVDYIHEAGGFTFHADKTRSFVLYPNGSAQPLRVNTWNHKATFIPPGSTIIVPRDPKPFNFLESAKEVGQILSNLAVTAVFIDDIRD